MLFSGTLRFNLDPFGKHSDAEIWTAIEVAHMKSCVSSLPNGLDYVISEGGENIRYFMHSGTKSLVLN